MKSEFLKEIIKERQLFKFLELKKIKTKQLLDNGQIVYDFRPFYSKLNESNALNRLLADELKRFLSKKRCSYEIFAKEVKKQKRMPISIDNIFNVINQNLYWSDTKQGHEFWTNIHNKWLRHFADTVVRPLYGKEDADKFLSQNLHF